MSQWHYTQLFLHNGDIAESDYPKLVAIADMLLIEVIDPLLQRFEPIIESYFFLRYNEAGYHIRLRIKAEETDYLDQIYPALTHALMAFRDATPLLADVAPEQFLQQALYEPEVDKYGGQDGIVLAEAHFRVSSAIAIMILRLEREKRIPRSLLAFIIMREIITQTLPHPMQASLFLLAYMRYWLIGKEEDQALQLLRQHATEKHAILAQADKFATHPVIGTWITDIQATLTPFFRLEDEAQLQTSIQAHLQQQASHFTPVLSYPITALLIMPNLIHVFHNRLGISTMQEAQLMSILYFNQAQTATHPIYLVLEPLAVDWLLAYYGLPPV